MYHVKQSSDGWLLFVLSEAGSQGAGRVRVWRALKTLGPAILRDGVYLLPGRPALERALSEQLNEVKRNGGQAFVFRLEPSDDEPSFRKFFDRTVEFATLVTALRRFATAEVSALSEAEARRALRALQRDYNALAATDYFPDRAQVEAQTALAGANTAFERRFSPGEPQPAQREIVRLDRNDFQGRLWATREHLWVDRVASAWLIRRFIDPQAQFRWLSDLRDCPAEAIGFDFDGASFTHIGDYVTFEVLLHSFGLGDDPGLALLGEMVRSLDVAGAHRGAEASGFEALMTGARAQCATDDELLDALFRPLSFLYAASTRRATDAPIDHAN